MTLIANQTHKQIRRMNIVTLKKLTKWGSNFLTLIMFVTLIFLAVVVNASKASGGEPSLFGYQFKTVLSGSMEPTFQTGSLIAVKTGGDMTRFNEKDIITFQEEDGKFVTHRIVEVNKNSDHTIYRTKGDNNASVDSNPVLAENVVAEYSGVTIPYAGYVVHYAQSQNGALLLLIPGFLLLLYAGFTIWRALSQIEKAKLENEDANEDKAKHVNT